MILALSIALGATLGQTPMTLMPEAERKAYVSKLTKDELEQVLKSTKPDVLLALSMQAINAFGPYQYVMVKAERINGTLQNEQTIRTTIREDPNAIRLEYLKGPSAGRKIIYNSSVKKDEFRVREAGLISVLGRLWIPMKSDLTKGDSNHTVAEAGLGSLVKRLQADGARAGDRLTVKHEGWTSSGHYCSLYTLPDGGKGFDNASTRVCFDPKVGVPMKVEGFDPKGDLLERYAFSDLKPITLDETTFDPDKGF
ncbi:MAG: DUF1571 domain-containing protein [Archangium sp.]